MVDHLNEARAHVSNAMDDLDEDHRAMPQLREAAYHLGMFVATLAPEASGADYRQIAHLIGSIFFAGDFKAETANERELEALLIKTGHRYQSWDEITALNPAPPTSGVDWRGHYIEVTAMRYMDNGLHRAAAMKAAEREARSMEAMTGTMQTVTMPTPADESGTGEECKHERSHGAPWRCAKCGYRFDDAARRARGESNG